MSGLSPQQVFQRALGGIAQVQRQFTVLPLCPAEFVQENTELSALLQSTEGEGGGGLSMMNMLDHGHLVNYGGEDHHTAAVIILLLPVPVAVRLYTI